MANTLGVYNPIFYANEALIQLEKALGMAGRVYRGYEAERNSFNRGEVINIRRPSMFTAADVLSVAQALNTETVALTLAYWKEVKFALTDKELAFTGERIINDHIRPAAYALADDIDQRLNGLYVYCPWYQALNATIAVDDVTDVRQTMFDNKVPLGDPSMIHYEVCGAVENGMLQLAAFSQNSGAGQQGVDTQMRGSLGTRFGMELFANQNVKKHTSGVCADPAGALVGEHAAGVTTLTIDELTVGGTFTDGDLLTITGDAQKYSVVEGTAGTTTVDGGGQVVVKISPALSATTANNTVCTFSLAANGKYQNMAWHRDAIALAVAPLPEMGNALGARIATITDPKTALSVRSRIYYVGASSQIEVALDILYGFKVLNPNMMARAGS